MTCPNCASTSFVESYSPEHVGRETELRDRFVRDRLAHPPEKGELKDLSDFFHSQPVGLVACSGCGLLVRGDNAIRPDTGYVSDPYDPAIVEHLYPRYLEAFRAKDVHYRHLLPPAAKVLEIGSHFGAFLQVAEEWGWSPTAVDVGKDTSAFAKALGFPVHTEALPDCGFPSESFDAVFIWNCFDQMSDPNPILDEIHRILGKAGILVVRTPNALFYKAFSPNSPSPYPESELSMRALAYNNLLGFPYLYGYTAEILNQMVERHGFGHQQLVNSKLLTMPFTEITPTVAREERVIDLALEPKLTANLPEGPWIELCYRKVSAAPQ